ncbi:MAG: DUF285 domain-containing protein [Spirochaetales bacterium]|nr:DUF285 domain-containing protein [Spirochaetales bacterium]
MTYFAFLAADNPALSADISVAVTDTLVRLNVPHGTALDTLVASFAITGESAVTEGVVQESGVTVNDFSADLVYTVTAADGGTQDYTVRIYTTVDRRQLDSMIAGDEDITRLDTSGITDMSYLFSRMTSFNQDIGDWDVSNVTDMSVMFGSALSFNQDISGWDVSSVMNMDSMFYAANAFNQDIGNWNVSNVTSMNTMFGYATAFNQDIGNWDVGNVTDMSYMFRDTESFNQDLSSWADHVTETIVHNDFSYGTCPLMTAYHPYPGWDN